MILITGADGQLGRQVAKALAQEGKEYRALSRTDADITDFDAVRNVISQIRPDAMVNCAAYTNVDAAEGDEAAAYAVNARGPANLARACAEYGAELVHISTDYVFSGEPIIERGLPRAYVETDACAPETAYGRTKLAGERLVSAECERHYILRTAWLYGDGKNFVRTMLALAQKNSSLKVVDDQIGSPTSTVDLAEAVCGLIGTGNYGLYHATCEGYCSWYGFAKKIFELAGVNAAVEPVSSGEFPRPAKRPKWSVLENARLKAIGKNAFRHWEDALAEYIRKEMKA